MKTSKFLVIVVLATTLALVIYKLMSRTEGFFSPYNFTSPPLPLLMPGYTGSYTGAVLPRTDKDPTQFEYTTLPFTWSRV